ncbi:hypothetical protein Tco_0397386 [Tanacetum coccineum]
MDKSKKRRSVSKQGRKAVKSSKGAPSVPTNIEWEDLDMDPDQGTDKGNEGTDSTKLSTDKVEEGTAEPNVNEPLESTTTASHTTTPTTPTPTPTTFGDDETIAQVLLNMSQAKVVSKEKEKGVELKDKRIEVEESNTKSEDINETEKKFKMLAHDEEITRKMQEDWEAEEENKRLLALRLQEERESSSLWKKEPNSFMIQLQLKEDMKTKTFKEIQVLYEKVKRFDESFTAIGSTEDERKIKEMNEKAKDPEQKRLKKKVFKETLKKDDIAKVPAKLDVKEQTTKKRKGGHIKMIARKKPRPQPDVNSDDDHRKCLRIVALDSTIDSEVMETKSVIARLNKVSSLDGDYLVIYRANGNFRAFNYLLEVLHIVDRQDLFHLHDLVMEQYSKITLEGIQLIL